MPQLQYMSARRQAKNGWCLASPNAVDPHLCAGRSALDLDRRTSFSPCVDRSCGWKPVRQWSRQPCLVATDEDPCGNGSELMATTASSTAISQRGVLRRGRRRRGGRQRCGCGRERNWRRCSWVTSDTDEHLWEECLQPDGVAFRRCAEAVSTLLS